MHGGDGVYSGGRGYSRVAAGRGSSAHRSHSAQSFDATDAFELGGAMLAFVTCWLAWWLCSLCLALFERNRRNRRSTCLFELGDEEPFRTVATSCHGGRARGARDFSPQRRFAAAAWSEGSDDDDYAYSEYSEFSEF
jgi:hypothetical protein